MKITNIPVLLLCFAVCFGAFGFGGLFIPGPWYESLNRAPWSPANAVFPIAWSILYAMIAVAGWLIFSQPKSTNMDLKVLWVAQIVTNALWSWIFFGQHWLLIGLINILIIDVLVLAMVVIAWRRALKITSFLMTPYLAWLALATSLNIYILLRN